ILFSASSSAPLPLLLLFYSSLYSSGCLPSPLFLFSFLLYCDLNLSSHCLSSSSPLSPVSSVFFTLPLLPLFSPLFPSLSLSLFASFVFPAVSLLFSSLLFSTLLFSSSLLLSTLHSSLSAWAPDYHV